MGCIKTNHKRVPKKALEERMKHYPAGAYLVVLELDIDESADDNTGKTVKLILVAYKYNVKKVLLFVMTENVGSTCPDPTSCYKAKYPDAHGNIVHRDIPRPACVSQYF
jgi:hypothetical protein